MISREDRILAIDLINEAVSNGANEINACEVLNISQRTLFRCRSKNEPDEDQRPLVVRPYCGGQEPNRRKVKIKI